jgi:putative ATP-dependent endonuclease of OLD family
VKWLVEQVEWPAALANRLPADGAPDAAYADPFVELFMHKKGADFLTLYFEQCTHMWHFPRTVLQTLSGLRRMVIPPPEDNLIG